MPQHEGNSRSRLKPVAVAGLVVLAVVAAAGSLPGRSPLSEGRGDSGRFVFPHLPALAGYILGAITIVLLCIWIALQVMGFRTRRGGERKSTPLWVQLTILLLALLLPGVIARGTDLFRGNDQANSSSQDQSDRATPSELQRSRALGIALTALLAVVLGGMVGGLAWLLWPAKSRSLGEEEEEEEALLEQLSASEVDLENILDPRAAVIACYARMERLLVTFGITRRSSDTPTELLARVLSQHEAAEPSVARLTDLFERARFSSHDVDERMRSEALAAVRDVRDQIAAAREARTSLADRTHA